MNKPIDYIKLVEFSQELLQKVGLSKEESKVTSEILVTADLCGVNSHGFGLLDTYIQRIKNGGIKLNPNREIEKSDGNLRIINADGGIGPFTALKATETAINIAEKSDMAMIMVKNSNHIGMLGYYANLIAENEMIGIVCTNSGPNVTAWGGAEPVLGNNAIAVAVPGVKDTDFLLDIASGEVACGKIRKAVENGDKEIPGNWILDKDGNNTTNPLDFLDGGVVLPFGQHKGYGIGMLIDLFTGVLSGGAFASEVNKQRENYSLVAKSSHTFIAIKIDKFMKPDLFYKRLDNWLSIIKDSKTAKGVGEILIPGEIENRNYKKNIHLGIELNEKQIDILKKLSIDYNGDYNSLFV